MAAKLVDRIPGLRGRPVALGALPTDASSEREAIARQPPGAVVREILADLPDE